MIVLLIRRLALTLILALLWLALLEQFRPHPLPLLVQADYQRCATSHNGPLATIKRPLGVKSAFSGVS